MKILWVKAGGLVPPDTGGKVRSYNILRHLAKHHAVTFFSFYAAHENDVHPELNQLFHRVVLAPMDLPPAKGIRESLEYAAHLFSRDPYNLTKYCKPPVRKKLRALLQEETHDVILCDFLAAAGAIPWEWPCAKVLFTHNVEGVLWQRHYEIARNPLWRAVSWFEWKKMDAAEQRYLRKADRVLAVSETDRNTFARFMDSQRLTVIPTGADTDVFRPTGEDEIPNSLVFVGSMDWLPNEDGIIYFVEEILPLILRQVPDATLCIVGRRPSRRLRDLVSGLPNVQLTGWAEDVRPYLAQRSVYIVPLRIGGGTRLKIFEAMSMAKAVVSTTIGAEGLPVQNGEHLFLADDPASFADRTLQLLGNDSLRSQIGYAARQLVEQNYGWATISKRFGEVLENVVWLARQR